jgi:transposase InsO family protein
METNPTEQRLSFLIDYASGQWSMSELCERYRVSRPTGYKWVKRVEEEGERGLEERSRTPKKSPRQTPAWIEQRILEARAQYGWGAKKLRQVLSGRYPTESWPARSTINAILDRKGKLRKQRRRRKWEHPGAAALVTERPNQVWPVDFKGQFRTLDGKYCYPLTVSDHYSRSVLLCKALPSVKTQGAKPAFRRLFREVGLPEAIRSDNGAPFASTGIHGLCELNVWWMQLGIVHQRITPASPQENGAHERMHRELKRETTRPPASNLRGQQRKFDRFRDRYNDERPHDGIGGELPAQRWTPSPRPYPERIPLPEYPSHLEVRRVSHAGCFRLKAKQRFLSNALSDQYIGLEEVDHGLWNIVYYKTLLGRIDEATGTITGVEGRPVGVNDLPGLL